MDAIRINVTVHQDDHPQLFEYLQAMPASNYRRHGRILALLNAGIGALSTASSSELSPSMKPISQNVAPPSPIHEQPLSSEQIDVDDDLLSLFGGSQ